MIRVRIDGKDIENVVSFSMESSILTLRYKPFEGSMAVLSTKVDATRTHIEIFYDNGTGNEEERKHGTPYTPKFDEIKDMFN